MWLLSMIKPLMCVYTCIYTCTCACIYRRGYLGARRSEFKKGWEVEGVVTHCAFSKPLHCLGYSFEVKLLLPDGSKIKRDVE